LAPVFLLRFNEILIKFQKNSRRKFDGGAETYLQWNTHWASGLTETPLLWALSTMGCAHCGILQHVPIT
jgi:hypothetical protein